MQSKDAPVIIYVCNIYTKVHRNFVNTAEQTWTPQNTISSHSANSSKTSSRRRIDIIKYTWFNFAVSESRIEEPDIITAVIF